MLSFQDALTEGLLEATVHVPSNYEEAMADLLDNSKLDWISNRTTNSCDIPTKLKILKGFKIDEFNIDKYNGRLTISFGFWDGENCKFGDNYKIQDALKSVLDKSGLKFEKHRYGIIGNANFVCELPKLDAKTYKQLLKLMSVLTERNLNAALKTVIGDSIPTTQLVEGFFKTAKLKVSSSKEVGVVKEWTIKSKDVDSDYNVLVRAVREFSKDHNSRDTDKITFPLQFGKYIAIYKKDGELFVKTYTS